MPETDTTLEDVRSAIDDLDRRIIGLIAERQTWVTRAGALKQSEDGVRAPARVEQVIARARAIATESGASPEVVETTYRAMIAGFIDLELDVHRTT